MTYDFKPLGYSLGILLFIGLIFPFILGFFVDPNNVTLSPRAEGLYDAIDNGASFDLPVLGEFNINPFAFFGSFVKNQILNSIVYLSLLPGFLITFIAILCSVAIIYAIIKLIP